MLQPFDDGPGPEIVGEEFAWLWRPINGARARTLANSICRHASSSLRVIVIQDHWFWIPSSGGQLWNWQAAERDIQQSQAMKRSLSDADWIFLNTSIPQCWNTRIRADSSSWNFFRIPSALKLAHQWNYMVALPVMQ